MSEANCFCYVALAGGFGADDEVNIDVLGLAVFDVFALAVVVHIRDAEVVQHHSAELKVELHLVCDALAIERAAGPHGQGGSYGALLHQRSRCVFPVHGELQRIAVLRVAHKGASELKPK